MHAVSSLALFGVAFALAACAESPPPKLAPSSAPSAPGSPGWLDETAARCARIASCTGVHDTPRLREPGACIDWWIAHENPPGAATLACLRKATTCDAIGECVGERQGARDAKAGAYCAAHGGAINACDGDLLVSCAEHEHESTLVDCATLGGHCEEKRSGGLVVRGCFSPALCPAGAPEERCDDPSTVVGCHDGAAERIRCHPGTRCQEHPDPNGERGATCEPVSLHEHCPSLGATYCKDGALVECGVHGHYGISRTSDCAAFGLRCASSGGGLGCVTSGVVECQPGGARCDGDDALTFCAAGRSVKVSCKSLGFGRCDPDGQGHSAACGAGPNVR